MSPISQYTRPNCKLYWCPRCGSCAYATTQYMFNRLIGRDVHWRTPTILKDIDLAEKKAKKNLELSTRTQELVRNLERTLKKDE